MQLNIAICDDLRENAQSLEKGVHEQAAGLCSVSVACFHSLSELFAELKVTAFDVLFLDIHLERSQNGISAAKRINVLYPSLLIIFVTSYLQYATDIYDATHIYFLTKPVSARRLRVALEQVCRRIELNRETRFGLPLRGSLQRVFSASEIKYFVRQGHTTVIHAAACEYFTPYKLVEIEPLLPAGCFARPHNSYLVNLMQVCEMSSSTVRLRDQALLPVSAAYKAGFSQALLRSIGDLNQ